MTPPDTRLDKQKRRHRGPLIGMVIVVIFAFAVIFYWIAELAYEAPGPQGQEEQEEQQETEPLSPEQLDSGDVEVPPTAPVDEVEPGDEDVIIE
ncbi:hypothetical protein SAMN05216196_10978 [Lutimaribacter pacificus]|uniref:Uncharacterized protein n=1 Tax=Lutimaribacter pacificus TaxID=391948 RepID=A0A1H0M796_9RHOB|nr:hypothetical protein [Lutimaribacter pacificus]SDO76227.1 hypothetical protein SAMN05216196_10978 [Lutimaribacter pacificus]SHK78547.1 hypothetical protein SAMN05444142_10978 [Lutimaribacter pacificus]